MPRKLGRIESYLKKKQMMKKIYQEEYAKAKVKNLRIKKMREVENVKKAARKKAEKFKLTPKQRSNLRKKKLAQFSKDLEKMGKDMEDAFKF